jgi:hypothetical protein
MSAPTRRVNPWGLEIRVEMRTGPDPNGEVARGCLRRTGVFPTIEDRDLDEVNDKPAPWGNPG